MKRAITQLLLVNGLIASMPLFADSGVSADINVSRPQSGIESLYLGASIGQASYSELDDSDIGFKLFAGISLNELVSVELGWVDFGSVESVGATVDASALYLGIVGSYELQNDLSLYGKLGFSSWDADLKANTVTASESGSDVTFGLGLNYQFSGHAGMQFSVDQYPLDDEDVTMFAIGIKYSI